MSKIALQGNASGTGTLTVAAPNTNTDYTLTLPAQTGTVLTGSGAINVNASAPADSVTISSTGQTKVSSSSNPAFLVNRTSSTGDAGISFQSTGTTVAKITGLYGDGMIFHTGSAETERARISAAGGFSVGTTADPGAGAIYATGNITAYYSSDRKFKENIKPIEGALDKVMAIGGKTFDWTDEYIASKGGEDGYFVQKSDFGVVAQDVQTVFPQAVRTRDDGSLAVDYEKLSALAFAAIVELKAEVEALKKG